MKAFLDTHAAVFMAQGHRGAFGARALELIDRSALFYSPFVELELQFLHEIGRVKIDAVTLTGALSSNYGVAASDDRVGDVAALARDLRWTRDPFDRVIVATAQLHRAPLITKDATIAEHFADAVW